MVAMETTTVMKILISILVNIKLFKGVKFNYDQIKEGNVIRNSSFQIFLFVTTSNQLKVIQTSTLMNIYGAQIVLIQTYLAQFGTFNLKEN